VKEALGGTESTIIACSNWAARGFINSGAPADKVVVVPCGVDCDTFKPAGAGRSETRCGSNSASKGDLFSST
jgi:glycosyltransferase involved in cell wall biosynthesis